MIIDVQQYSVFSFLSMVVLALVSILIIIIIIIRNLYSAIMPLGGCRGHSPYFRSCIRYRQPAPDSHGSRTDCQLSIISWHLNLPLNLALTLTLTLVGPKRRRLRIKVLIFLSFPNKQHMRSFYATPSTTDCVQMLYTLAKTEFLCRI